MAQLAAAVGTAPAAAFCLPVVAFSLCLLQPLLFVVLYESAGEAWRLHAPREQERHTRLVVRA